MITETKKPSLLPSLDKTLEEARIEHFSGPWAPGNDSRTDYRPAAAAHESASQADKLKPVRDKERSGMFRKVAPYVGVLAAAATVAGVGAYNKLTQPQTRPVDMLVQPYDNPSTVAQRAESRFGSDPADFDIHEEALRLSDKYGVLHAGDHLKVFVK